MDIQRRCEFLISCFKREIDGEKRKKHKLEEKEKVEMCRKKEDSECEEESAEEVSESYENESEVEGRILRTQHKKQRKEGTNRENKDTRSRKAKLLSSHVYADDSQDIHILNLSNNNTSFTKSQPPYVKKLNKINHPSLTIPFPKEYVSDPSKYIKTKSSTYIYIYIYI